MSEQSGQQQPTQQPTRRPGELTARELGRFVWRQLTSMRTALVLLLLLALAATTSAAHAQESAVTRSTTEVAVANLVVWSA